MLVGGRYYGYYSNRSRGQRAKRREKPEAESRALIDQSCERQAANMAWTRLIKKVYEIDPLECPRCGAKMRIIALVEQPCVIQRILRFAFLLRLDGQGTPSLACPFPWTKVHWTFVFFRLTLEHLGAWEPRPSGRDPPTQPPPWPSGVTLPLAYHPVPDIA